MTIKTSRTEYEYVPKQEKPRFIKRVQEEKEVQESLRDFLKHGDSTHSEALEYYRWYQAHREDDLNAPFI